VQNLIAQITDAGASVMQRPATQSLPELYCLDGIARFYRRSDTLPIKPTLEKVSFSQ
jgi:hypothetical protein